jgi:nicotinate dehydrogenase subunit B
VTTFTDVPKHVEEELEMSAPTPSRRSFLKRAGLLVVSFSAAGIGPLTEGASAQPPAGSQGGGPYRDPDFRQLDSWIVIHEDNTATFFVGKTDCGQGTGTSFRQLMSDELDIAYDKTACIMGSTDVTVDQGGSGGSTAMERDAWPMRRAAAEARRVMLEMGSAQLGVPVDRLTVSAGVITVKADPSKSVTYGQLVGGKRFNVALTGKDINGVTGVAAVKPVQEHKITGQSPQRYDIPAKVDGSLKWAVDVKLPGMVHAQHKTAGRGCQTDRHRRIVRAKLAGIRQGCEQGQLRGSGLRTRGAGHQSGQAAQSELGEAGHGALPFFRRLVPVHA